LRIDNFDHNCHVDRVAAESLAPGIPSLRPITSLNQRALKTCIHINETGKALIQPDTINAPIQPPKALMNAYGVKAQMLLPLMSGDEAGAWISVHYVPSTREWSEKDVEELHAAGRQVCDILHQNGWAECKLK